jgi:hypothetical protein
MFELDGDVRKPASGHSVHIGNVIHRFSDNIVGIEESTFESIAAGSSICHETIRAFQTTLASIVGHNQEGSDHSAVGIP